MKYPLAMYLTAKELLANGDERGYFSLLKESAELGNPMAQVVLGNHYLLGRYIDQDVQKAFDWTKKSADVDFTAGIYGMAFYNLLGVNTEKDLDKAILQYKIAIDRKEIRNKK